MSLIIFESNELIQSKSAALRRELLRMSLAAGAVILSIMLVAPVLELKPKIRAFKVQNNLISNKTEIAASGSLTSESSNKTQTNFNTEKILSQVAKHKPHYFALEFHHKME